MKRPTLLLVAGIALSAPAFAAVESVAPIGSLQVSDSAMADMASGRFWHAARRLRADGAAAGAPAEVLLLARAEAGWKNWDVVVDLLHEADWLSDVAGGDGWYLLARGHEAAERWTDADAAYGAFRPESKGAGGAVASARRARSAARTGGHVLALEILDGMPEGNEALKSWMALELAELASEEGDTALVGAYAQRIIDSGARSAGWRVLADARLAAGDSVSALATFQAAVAESSGSRRAIASTEAALLIRAAGDAPRARAMLLGALDDAPTATAGRAAGALVDDGDLDQALALRLARILDRAGDGRRALRAYDSAAGSDAAALPEWARLARARLMGTVRSRQEAALEEFRAIRVTTEDPAIGIRNLELWAAMRGRQGRDDAVRTLRGWMLEEYPNSAQASVLLWNRGFGAEGRGDVASALSIYATLIDNGGTHVRATQARMRIGQIRIAQNRITDAAAVFDEYLSAYPDGGRWEEASYWSASTHLMLGDTARAQERVARVRAESPLSYYAVMGADLLGQPFDVDVPQGETAVRPGWLVEGLRRVDALTDAGLDTGAKAEVDRLLRQARGSSPEMLTLAEELLERGRTIDGINVGWELRREGHAWDRRLVKVVYPFPYRDLVVREAEEWGVDPIMLAAIIRQESAFKADIISHAGAVGLMQVMPPTGRALARAHGPDSFQDESLTTPEVNLHLGAAFFVEMSDRYDNQLPIVLSAYNAGPTRATRWRRYPEAADLLRFTERIPFDETRGYVKNVSRNRRIYEALYQADIAR